jgi:hypothetical protein
MNQPRQGDLFAAATSTAAAMALELPMERRQLLEWQERVARFQAPLFQPPPATGSSVQGVLFASGSEGGDPAAAAARFEPLRLTAQTLQFWRWPQPPQRGAALYVVTDRPEGLPHPLLLYVGETGCADRRWKGEHDCKAYLASYGEALQRVGLAARPSIRFWCDVPVDVKPRRALEQALIRRWQPPFNKETRARWATPFTHDPP